MNVSAALPTLGPGNGPASRWYAYALVVLVIVCGAVVVGVSTGAATAVQDTNQTSPPELHSGERVNTTAVELLFIDDNGVDTGSIAELDFLLSNGDISHVSATPTGTNATVTLVLSEPIDSEELTVGLRSDNTIQDVDGEEINTDDGAPTVTIGGMDGVPPQILATDVNDAIGGPAEIRFTVDEELSALDVEITGPGSATLDIEDFDTVGSNEYVAKYDPPESGEYTMALDSLTDTSGNTGEQSLDRTFDASRTEPEAAIGIDFGASSSFNISFDGGQSRGERLSYRWDFGDRTTADGEQVSHEFVPGVYDVKLTVTDELGNSGTDVVELNLTGGLDDDDVRTPDGRPDDPTVLVTRGEPPTSPTALASVTGARAGATVDIGTADSSEPALVTEQTVALDAIAVTPTINTSFSVALTAIATGGVADAAGGGKTVVGGFSLLGDFARPEVERARLTFSVDTGTLERRGISPESIELHSDSEGEWRPVETSRVAQMNDTVQFRSTVQEFSRFAVVGSADPEQTGDTDEEANGTDGDSSAGEGTQTDDITVTDATVMPTEIESGEFVQVTATVENQGERTVQFRPALEVDGSVAAFGNTTEIDPSSTENVFFNSSLDGTGNVTVGVNGTEAGVVRINGTDTQTDEYDANNEAFNITEVTLNETSIDAGESIYIEASVRNEADETANFLAEIRVDGERVDTVEVPQVPPNSEIPVPRVTRQFNETGTYTISVSGVESEQELSVGQSSGLFGFLGFLPLGFLPLGLVQTVATFLGIPLLFLYLLLKSVAFYLGY